MKHDPAEIHTEQPVYILNGVVHLPHYTKPGVFVSPGYGTPGSRDIYSGVCHQREHTADELLALGATMNTEWLWKRILAERQGKEQESGT